MSMQQNMVETSRVILIPFEYNHFELIYRIYSNKKIMRLLVNGARTKVEMARELNQMIREWEIYGLAPFAVIHKSTNQLIGRSGLYFNSRSEYPQLGYVIAEEMQGQGLATECAKASINYGFARGYQRIDGFTHCENYVSITILNRKLGMSLINDNCIIGGNRHYQFALTLDQYQTMHEKYNSLIA